MERLFVYGTLAPGRPNAQLLVYGPGGPVVLVAPAAGSATRPPPAAPSRTIIGPCASAGPC